MGHDYRISVVKETVPEAPTLLQGESIAFVARPAFSPIHWLAVIILTFVPPFVWGLAVFLMLRHQKKHGAVWVTNQRLVHFEKKPLVNKYRIASFPLSQVSEIKKDRLSGGPSDLIGDLFNRMLGIADVGVFVKGSASAQHSITNIKPAGALIKFVRDAVANP